MHFEEIKRLLRFYNADTVSETKSLLSKNIDTVRRAIDGLPSERKIVKVKELDDPAKYALYNFSQDPIINGLIYPCCAFTKEYPLLLCYARYASFSSFSHEEYLAEQEDPLMCTAVLLTDEFPDVEDLLKVESQTYLLLNHIQYSLGMTSYFIDFYVGHPRGQLYYVVELIQRWWRRVYPLYAERKENKRKHSTFYVEVMNELKYLPRDDFPVYKRAEKEFYSNSKHIISS